MNRPENGNWYDALYGDDPSTDNIFGREELAERRAPLLQVFLRHGGRLSDYFPRQAALREPAQVIAAIDRALASIR